MDVAVVDAAIVEEALTSPLSPGLELIETFIPPNESEQLFVRLVAEQPWPDNHYQVFGRQFTLPRLQTWHADPGIVYCYSNNLLVSRPWNALLSSLRRRVEEATGCRFNAVLVNYYRDGSDYVGWHCDDDAEMGEAPVIVSLSLGAARDFSFRRKGNHGEVGRLVLSAGSLLRMPPQFQRDWEHSVLPVGHSGGRINLTFRYLFPPERATILGAQSPQ